jgi:hypothetical protein
MWEGTVVSIHIAPEASAPMRSVTEVRVFPGRGLQGDRYFTGRGFYSKKTVYFSHLHCSFEFPPGE